MPVQIPADRPRVEITLRDGTPALLSPILPEDRALIEEGLEHLSIESRFTRFGQGVSHLSQTELDYLTSIDQRSHVAWGAIVDGEAAGVGRYVCAEEADCCEVAVTVIDRFQRRGLGTALFAALAAIARADGVEELCFEVVPGNAAAEHMIEALEPQLDEAEGGLIQGRLRVKEIPVQRGEAELVAVMNQVRS